MHPHRHVQARNVEEQPQDPGTPPSPPPGNRGGAAASPPESTFKKLQPADSRYTLLNDHDEL